MADSVQSVRHLLYLRDVSFRKGDVMTRPVYIRNAVILLENGELQSGDILIEQGKIQNVHLSGRCPAVPNQADIIEATDLIAIPGFIDLHIHGVDGADTMDASEAALDRMAKALPKEGTTSFLATTMTASEQEIDHVLCDVGNYKKKRGQAEMLGVHLEGPFLQKSKAGAQRREAIRDPNIRLLHKWQKLSRNRIKIITIAPELDPEGEFIRAAIKYGIVVSAGHTEAHFEQMKKATEQGVSQLTHLCNAMNGIHHRDVGAVGAAFLLPDLKAELIADGIHVSKQMVELIYRNMGSERLLLITDSLRAKGLPDGEYELGGQMVKVTEGVAMLPDETLAGSILKMHHAAKNFFQWTDCTLYDIALMTAVNPARQIGVYHRKGSITVGKDADILLIDKNFRIHHVLCRGMIIEQEEV